MSDKPPHFMHAHRTRRQRRAAAPLFLRRAAPLFLRRKRRAVAPQHMASRTGLSLPRILFRFFSRSFRAVIPARAAAPLLGVAVAATLLFAPVFHGVAQAAYFTQVEGWFNHLRLLGQSRDGQPPQLVPTETHMSRASSSSILPGRLTLALRPPTESFLSGGAGAGAVTIILAAIQDSLISFSGTGSNSQLLCSPPNCNPEYTSPAVFFTVAHDRLDATQTFVNTNDRRVTFTVVSIDTGPTDSMATLAAVPEYSQSAALDKFTVYVNGVQATPTDFVMESQSGVTDPISGLNADIVSASVIIANSADQPTSATFFIVGGHRGTASGRTQLRGGFRSERTVTYAARQGQPQQQEVTVGFQDTTFSVGEGAGQQQVCVAVTAPASSEPLNREFSLSVSSRVGTAGAGDFTAITNQTVGPFNQGTRRNCFNVAITDDGDTETSENFFFDLAPPPGQMLERVTINPSQATVTITDNDAAAAEVSAVSAGADQRNVLEGGAVTLSGRVTGSGSLSYRWTQVASAALDAAEVTDSPIPFLTGSGDNSLTGSGAAEATFTAPEQARSPNHGAELTSTEYHFRLVGSDGSATTTDTVSIQVIDGSPPVVWVVSTDQTVVEGARLTLDGRILLNAPGVGLNSRWREIDGPGVDSAVTAGSEFSFISVPHGAGRAAAYTNEGEVTAAPEQTNGAQTTYYFRLDGTRTDNSSRSSIVASVTVRDDDGTPTANAGGNQMVNTGAMVTLDASGSADATGATGSGANLTYAWLQTTTISSDTEHADPVTLSDAAAASTTFSAPSSAGDLFFKLTVTDTITGNTNDARVTVTVQAAATPMPGGMPTVVISAGEPNAPADYVATVTTATNEMVEVSSMSSRPNSPFTGAPATVTTYQTANCLDVQFEGSSVDSCYKVTYYASVGINEYPRDDLHLTAAGSTNSMGGSDGLRYSWMRVADFTSFGPGNLFMIEPAGREINRRFQRNSQDYWFLPSAQPERVEFVRRAADADEVPGDQNYFVLQVGDTAAGTTHTALVTVDFINVRTLVLSNPQPDPVDEGDDFSFTVNLIRTPEDAASPTTVTVEWRVRTDSGITRIGNDPVEADDFAGTDFPDGTLTFAPSENSTTVVVGTVDDAMEEDAETYFISLDNPAPDRTGLSLASDRIQARARLTALIAASDQTLRRLSIAQPAAVDEGANVTATVSIARIDAGEAASPIPVTVDWTIAAGGGGSPADAADFDDSVTPAFPTGTLTIPANQDSVVLSVPTIDDSAAESSETYTITLSNPVPAEGSVFTTTTVTGEINSSDQPTAPPEPVVTVGADQTVDEGSTPIVLSGTVTRGAGDTTSDALTYEWVQVASAAPGADTVSGGPALDNGGSNTPGTNGVSTATFTVQNVDVPTDYYFVLVGQSGASRTTTGTAVTITVRDTDPPTESALTITPAIVGSAAEGATATISVTAAGPGNDPGLTYQWAQASPDPTGPGNPVITFASSTAASTVLTWPDIATRTTREFRVEVTITDSGGLTRTTDTTVIVRDTTAPTANAGADQQVDTGAMVTLDAGASRNAAGNAGGITYTWQQVDGANSDTVLNTVTLNMDDNSRPAVSTFTAPMSMATLHFRVTVTDEVTQVPHADWVTVTVTQPAVAPVVSVGAALRVDEETAGLVLTGTVVRAATDNPDSTLSFEWVQVESAAADAAQVAAGAANRVTATAIATTPGMAGAASATFTSPRATDRRGNGVRVIASDQYFYRLIGRSSVPGQAAEVSSATLMVTVYPPRGVYVSGGGFRPLGSIVPGTSNLGVRIPESRQAFDVTVYRRDGVQPAIGQINISAGVGGSTLDNTGVAPTPGEVPNHVRPDFRFRNVVNGAGQQVAITAGNNTAVFQYEILGDSVPEDEEGVGFGYGIAGGCDGCVIEYQEGFVQNAAIQDDDTITVGWQETAVTANEGDGVVTLTAVITSPAAGQTIERSDFNLRYATADGTASSAADADFTAIASTAFTLGAGTRSVDIPVTLTNDENIELGAGETFTVRISTATDTPLLTAIGAATATVTIQDDDFPEAVLGIAPSATSFNEGDTNAHFDIALTGGPFNTAVTVDFAVTGTGITTGDYDITAPTGIDMAASAGTFTLTTDASDTAGSPQNRRVTLTISDDDFSEAMETLVLDVRTSIGAASQTSVTIAASDALNIFLIGPSDTAEGGTHTFTVNMEGGGVPPDDLRVAYTLGAGTRVDHANAVVSGAGADITDPNGGAITIPAGSQLGEIMLSIIDDNLNEGIEQYSVTIAANDVTPGYGTPTITNGRAEGVILASDDITVSIDRSAGTAASINEGESAEFTVTLSGASSGSVADITVPYSLSAFGGEATDTGDGSLIIAAGDTEGTITINTSNSAARGLTDPDEALTVTLGASPTAGDGGGSVSRTADTAGQSAQVTVNFVDETHSLALEGATSIDEADMATSATYTVRRTGPAVQSGNDLVITWAAVAGTAVAADFDSGSLPGGTLTFSGSAETATFRIDIEGDNLNEAGETFDIAFSIAAANQAAATANGGVAVPSTRSVTINDDDPVEVTLSRHSSCAASVAEASGGTVCRFTAAASGGTLVSGVTVVATIGIRTGGATGVLPSEAGLSISPSSNPLPSLNRFITTVPGSNEFYLRIVDDNLNETTETYTVYSQLSGAPQTRLTGQPADLARAGAVQFTSGGDSASVDVTDDDAITVSVTNRGMDADDDLAGFQVEEDSSAVFRVSIDHRSASDVSVPFTITGLEEEDVTGGLAALPASPLTFSGAQMDMDITIPLAMDTDTGPDETAETVTFTLTADDAGTAAINEGPTAAGVISPSATAGSAMQDVIPRSGLRTLTVTGPASIDETDADAESGQYSIGLVGEPYTRQTVVTWTVTNVGTADADFVAASDRTGTVTFGNGDAATKTFTLSVAGDNLHEAAEAFTVQVSVADPDADDGTEFGDAARTTINDDDDIRLSISPGETTIAENGGSVTLTVDLDAVATADIDISYGSNTAEAVAATAGTDDVAATGSDSAGPGIDIYVGSVSRAGAFSGSIRIGNGERSGTVTLNITDDNLNEPPETFALTAEVNSGHRRDPVILPGARTLTVNGSPIAAGIVTITDNDPVEVSIAAARSLVNEGEDAVFNISLTAPSAGDISVPYTISGVTAPGSGTEDDPVDYNDAGASPLTVAANSTMGSIRIGILSDATREDTETMVVTLGDPTGGTGSGTVDAASAARSGEGPRTGPGDSGGGGAGTGPLASQNDRASVTIAQSTTSTRTLAVTGPATLNEGETGNYAITLTGSPFTVATVVSWTVANADLTGTGQNTTSTATVQFAPSDGSGTEKSFTLDITDDNLNEAMQTAMISLSVADSTTDGGTAFVGHRTDINDNDPITVTIANAGTVNEGDTASFAVTLSGGVPTAAVLLPYTLAATGAGFLDDWDSHTQVGSLAAGTTQGAITFTIRNDGVNESAETLTLTLGTPETAGAISGGGATATATIAQSNEIRLGLFCQPPPGSVVGEGQGVRCEVRDGSNISRQGPITVEWMAAVATQTNLDTAPQSNTRANADSDGERDLNARDLTSAENEGDGAVVVNARAAGIITGTLTAPPFEPIGGSVASLIYGAFSVDVVQDGREESTETFTVSITRVVSQYEGSGSIIVEDFRAFYTYDIPANLAAQRFVAFNAATADAAEGDEMTIPVELTGIALESDVTVAVTATAGAGANPAEAGDYELLTPTLTFTGTGTENVRLRINDDAVNESIETVLVSLGTVTGGGGTGAIAQSPNSVTVSIAQSDPITSSIEGPATADEGTQAEFTVRLSNPSEAEVGVAWLTLPASTAQNNADYAPFNHVSLSPGQVSTMLTIVLNEDSLIEADEILAFEILDSSSFVRAQGGELMSDPARRGIRLTISDNDDAHYTITPVETTVAEGGAAQFNINLVRQSDDGAVTAPGDVVVPWSASVSQANSGDANTQAAPDLTGSTDAAGATLSGEATITAGQSMATITLSINSDQLAEDEETLTVTLGTPPTLTPETGVVQRSPASDSAQVTIPENTAASRILTVARASGAALSEPLYENQESPARDDTGADLYELVLSIPAGGTSSEAITVEWSVVAGAASANANPAEPAEDFNVVSGTTTFAAGAADGAMAIVALQLAEDTLNEGEESFSVEWTLNPANPDVAPPLRLDGTIARSSSDTIALSRAASTLECTEGNSCAAFTYRDNTGIEATEDVSVTFTLDATGAVDGDNAWEVREGGIPLMVEQTANVATMTISALSYNQNGQRIAVQFTQLEDSFNEDTQTVVVRVTAAESAGAVSLAGVNPVTVISPDDDPTTVVIGDAPAATEGDSAMFPVEFIGGIPTRDVEIDWAVVLTGTTAEAADFEMLTGTERINIDFPTGLSDAVTSGVVRVPLAMDADDEEDRFIVQITAARGAGGSGISVGAGEASTAMAVINRLDLSPPRFADPDAQPGWTAGQQVLWVKLNEDFKVLPAATGAMASTDAASLTTLNAGDFTVTDNFGNASSAVIAVTGVTPFPDETDPALRLALASAIEADEASVQIAYEYTGGNAIFDTAVERGLEGPEGRNRMQDSMVLLTARAANPTLDADDDGIPDAAEARISGDAGNPFAAVTDEQQPAFRFIYASNRGPAPTRSPVAYSGIREHGVRDHLGVLSMTSTTQTAAQTLTAYYRSDTFGYDGTYQCATGQFPANYDAPLAEGGCAAVDWGNVAPSTDHTIAWLARSADGVWKTDRSGNSASNLPEQMISRIPELNMDAQSRFTTGTVVIRASLDAAPGEALRLQMSETPADGGTATTVTAFGRQTFAVTRTSAASAVWEITNLHADSATFPVRLYRPAARSTTSTAVFVPNFPASDQYSLGLVRQTRVTRVNVAVPPVLGREFLQESVFQQQGIALVDGNSADYNLEILVENLADIGDGDPSVTATELNGALTVTGVNLPSQLGGFNAFRVNLRMNSGLLAAGTNTAVIQVEVTGGFGGVTTATYRFPVVAMGAPLAQRRRDGDFDGIADDFDDFENSDHLPVVVDEEAGASAWHHIRPALPVHDLRLGEATAERLARVTMADQVDEYAEYSASETPPTTSNLAVVYDFEIGGVDYAEVTTEGRTGGEAGVIIPLPRDLYDSGASLVKYPSDVPFSVEGENDYGFATLQEDGACPDDTMAAGSPYREGDTLRRAKRGGDACLVVYIVDGGPNDEDGVANGVIKDPLGIRVTALGGGGSRSHSGAFGPVALAALAALLLLMLALLLKPSRRRRRA